MTRRAGAAVLLALFAAVSSTGVGAQFTASTSGVRLDVLALDGRTPRAGLTADDFEVRDNGVVQRVDSLATTDAAHVIVVLDVSGSVQGAPLERLVAAANALLARLTDRDRLTVVGFAHHVRLLTPPNGVLHPDLLPLGGSTALHDAVFTSLLLGGADPRPALMVLLTDGLDSASWLGPAQALDMATRADVTIYPVVAAYDSLGASRTPGGRQARRHLEHLAGETGGRVFPVDAGRPLEGAFLRILEEYRHRYVLTYSPQGVERRGWHRVDVRLKAGRGTVHTRRGYDVP